MAATVELVRAYQEQLTRREDNAAAILAALWRSLGSWEGADVERALAQIIPYVYAAQNSSAALTSAYLTRMGVPPAPPAPELRYVVDELRGVPATEVYKRPFKELWRGLSEGNDFTTAFERSLNRLTTQAQTDMQMSMRQVTVDRLDAPAARGVVLGYRRVTRGGCCSLCAVASTQRYHKSDLMPIHGNCRCKVAPIFEGEDGDPGNVVNGDRLKELRESGAYQEIKLRREATKARQRGNEAAALKLEERLKAHREKFGSTRNPQGVDDSRFRGDEAYVRQHGEHGPTLTNADHNFTGPSDI